jgi:AcrR family transcriptional regulator
MDATPTRAQPLSHDERKRAILDAVIPLVVERGATVTTAEMASAAGVAEGTIYSVFPDKATLMAEAVKVALDPEPVRSAILAIDGPSVEAQLIEAARILTDRFTTVVALLGVLRTMRGTSEEVSDRARSHVMASNEAVSAAIEELLERHQHHLRVTPREAATAFSGLVVASAWPMVPVDHRLGAAAIADILLRGVTEPTA